MKDLELIMTIVKAMKPDVVAPVAPVLPIAPVSTHDDAVIANNIQYIQRDIVEIKGTLEKITTTHVTLSEFNDHVRANKEAHDDFERRMREQGTRQTQILTVVAILTFIMSGITVWSKLSGH